jgi:hypothetical protein
MKELFVGLLILSSIIGLKNVFQLLHTLSLKDRKYTPASLLSNETEQL